MSTTSPHKLLAATQVLAARIAQALTAPPVAPGALLRIEVPIEGIAPLAWLREQHGCTQYYWRGRDSAFIMAGVGEADVFMPDGTPETSADIFRRMRARLGLAYPALRYYGGFRFRRGVPAEGRGARWRGFADYRFVVPRFELLQRKRGSVIACNAVCGDAEHNARELDAILDLLVRLRFRREPGALRTPRVTAREDHPDEAGWHAQVAAALEAFAQGTLEKVVLARESCFTTEDVMDPVNLLARLAAASPNSYEFCFSPVAERAFIGASPERLFKRHNVLVESEALAGTRPRGKSDEEDIELGDELLRSGKERAEHEYVAGMLRERLRDLCVQIEMPEQPRLKRLRHVQHLYTPIQGILKDTLNADATLLDTLHPTPAVGGTPREAALSWIEQHEPFDRGIYAAPVGWVGFDGAEFCVAIRSGLIRGNTLSVYSGAGIVPGSDAAQEWAEVEAKMANFVDALSPVEEEFDHGD